MNINILVTAIGGAGHGDQILKALLHANNEKYKIFGADVNPVIAQAKTVEKFIQMPYANNPAYLQKLYEICEQYKIDVLFHGCEAELKLFSDNREAIRKRNIFLPINTKSVIDICMDKGATNKKLNDLGFECPKYVKIKSVKELNIIDWFPVVIKPSVGGGGSANVYIVQNKKQLEGLAKYLDLTETEIDFFIQEYVGSPDEEFTVGVLHDLDGEYINSIAVKRILNGGMSIRTKVNNTSQKKISGENLVISSGISQGEIGRHPQVTEQCVSIANALNSKGPMNIQCRLVEGRVMVFEINPRFSGTTSLRAMVGYNEPDILIRKHVLNETIQKEFKYDEHTILRTLQENII